MDLGLIPIFFKSYYYTVSRYDYCCNNTVCHEEVAIKHCDIGLAILRSDYQKWQAYNWTNTQISRRERAIHKQCIMYYVSIPIAWLLLHIICILGNLPMIPLHTCRVSLLGDFAKQWKNCVRYNWKFPETLTWCTYTLH